MKAPLILKSALALFMITAIIFSAGFRTASAADPPSPEKTKQRRDIESAIAKQVTAGVPLKDILKPGAFHGAPVKDVIAAALKAGASPAQVVYTAIHNGYPVGPVVKAALDADAPLDAVVSGALAAGVDKKTIFDSAIEAGVWPGAVANALAASSAGTFALDQSPLAPRTLPSLFAAPAYAILGRGGVELRPLPEWKEGKSLGPLRISPFIAVMETWSDNVLFTPTDTKKDSITTVMPGLRMELPFRNQKAEAEYYSVIARYTRQTEENVTDHHASAALDLRAGGRIGLRLSDSYARDHELRSSSATGQKEVFRSNNASALASYLVTDYLRVQAGYAQQTWHFNTSPFRDRDESAVLGRIFLRLFSNSAAFIEYELRKLTYEDSTLDFDGKTENVSAGLTWDLSPQSKGTVKAGLARRGFDSPDRSAFTVKTGSVDIRHEFTAGTSLVLTGQRSLNEPNLPGTSHFNTFGGYAELSQTIVPKLALAVRGSYVQDVYFFLDGYARTDWTSVVGGGMKFRAAKWMEFAVDFNYHARKSDVPEDEYIERSTMITATMAL